MEDFCFEITPTATGVGGENLMSSCLALMSQRERERGREGETVGEWERKREREKGEE